MKQYNFARNWRNRIVPLLNYAAVQSALHLGMALHQGEEMKNRKLIKCGDHKYAPWCVVCNHIINGTTQECVRVPLSEAGDGLQDEMSERSILHWGENVVK